MLSSLATSLHLPVDVVSATILLIGKATALLLLALGATWLMRRTSAVSRYLVWFASLAAILVVPVIIALSPVTVPILPAITPITVAAHEAPTPTSTPTSTPDHGLAGSEGHRDASPTPDASQVADGVIETRAPTGVGESAEQAGISMSMSSPGIWLVAVWAAVAAVLATRLLLGAFAVRRTARRATSLQGTSWDAPLFEIADRLSLDDAPRLLLSNDIVMPFACGLTTPTIVLPKSAEQWSADQRSAVLLHEIAHIKRRDLVGHTIGRVACALYWFHPLVWRAAKGLRAESERACDDMALLCGARATDYAEHLLDIVSQVKRNTTPSVALAMATRSEFEGRMLAILDPSLTRVTPRHWQSATLLGAAALVAITTGVAVPASAAASGLRAAGQEANVEARAALAPRAIARDVESADTKRAAQPLGDQAQNTPSMARRSGDDEPTDAELGMASMQLIRDAIRLAETEAAKNRTKPSPAITTDRTVDSGARAAALVHVLRTDKNGESRRVAAWGLSKHTDSPDVVDALIRVIARDSIESVREMAAWALGEGGAQKAGILALREAVRNDRSTVVQITAIWALGRTGSSLAEADITELGRALGSPSARVREIAAWALHEIEDSAAVRPIENALRRERTPEVQVALVRALSVLGEPGIDALKRLLGDSDPTVRAITVRSLASGSTAGPWQQPRLQSRPTP